MGIENLSIIPCYTPVSQENSLPEDFEGWHSLDWEASVMLTASICPSVCRGGPTGGKVRRKQKEASPGSHGAR